MLFLTLESTFPFDILRETMLILITTSNHGKSSTNEYKLVEDGKQIGMIQVRRNASASVGFPPVLASHIYYEIDPEYRGKGHGKKILALGLNEAKNLGLEELVITCLENNIASQKIIESNGGILEASVFIPQKNEKVLKYRISLK